MSSNNGRPGTASHSMGEQMPRITEGNDDENAPAIPEKSPRRLTRATLSVRRKLPYPLQPPPAYRAKTPSSSGTYDGPVEPLPKDKRPTWRTQRGGWGKLALFLLLGICCVVALVVGLVLGLKGSGGNSGASNKDSGEPDTSSPDDEAASTVFPEGSYTFVTALSNVSTACVTDPSAFRCYPFETYSGDDSTEPASFLWTITATDDAQEPYTITAPSTVFGNADFSDLPLSVRDAGLPTEHLEFSYVMGDGGFATIVNNTGSDGGTITCYYNTTQMTARIFTHAADGGEGQQLFPADLASRTGVDQDHPSTDFDEWPFRVEVAQTVGPGGPGTPDCRDAEGREVDGLGYEMPQGGGTCGCWYRNYDL